LMFITPSIYSTIPYQLSLGVLIYSMSWVTQIPIHVIDTWYKGGFRQAVLIYNS
jgi:hypothetical protein